LLASCATIPTAQEANDAVLMLRNYGSWAWALGIALMWADLVLPIPQTAVIAASIRQLALRQKNLSVLLAVTTWT
jgi:hypothetical protein